MTREESIRQLVNDFERALRDMASENEMNTWAAAELAMEFMEEKFEEMAFEDSRQDDVDDEGVTL